MSGIFQTPNLVFPFKKSKLNFINLKSFLTYLIILFSDTL